MDKQDILFEQLKDIKDYWSKTVIEGLQPEADLIWSDNEESYKVLSQSLQSKEEQLALEKVINESIKGVIHSILVMIDGGDSLSDHYRLDIIDEQSKESIKQGKALHEEFYEFLINREE